jgi:hypothetical protein
MNRDRPYITNPHGNMFALQSNMITQRVWSMISTITGSQSVQGILNPNELNRIAASFCWLFSKHRYIWNLIGLFNSQIMCTLQCLDPEIFWGNSWAETHDPLQTPLQTPFSRCLNMYECPFCPSRILRTSFASSLSSSSTQPGSKSMNQSHYITGMAWWSRNQNVGLTFYTQDILAPFFQFTKNSLGSLTQTYISRDKLRKKIDLTSGQDKTLPISPRATSSRKRYS